MAASAKSYSVALVSLGCAKNLVNSEQMAFGLAEAGFRLVPSPRGADAAVVNTCAFIGAAKQEAIDTLLRLGELKKEGALGKIIVAGCLAERYKDEIARELPEADGFVGVGGFGAIAGAVEEALRGGRPSEFPPPEACDDNLPRAVSTPRAWAYLKIADGCDNRCAFCAVPAIRGRYRSRRAEDILAEAGRLAASGARELIVIAQDTTRYGLDLYGERRLVPLLRRLSEIPELRWIRLHYLYPDGVTEDLIREIAGNPKLLKYLDIPVQHINDGILKSMRRRGTGADIRGLIARLRREIPGAVLRTSVITGLPGEGEREFEELCDFLREAKFERAGVFTYSPEEGTDAFDMPRPDADTARRRAEEAEELQSHVIDAFNASRVGTETAVLVEGREGGALYGRSCAESPDIDGAVIMRGEAEAGDFARVLITGADGGDALGAIISVEKAGGPGH
ncbi:MAG: 30S ribosomal protein S12 methylthiotransferase RimO [Oscillospiraceae bacterium]|jgi:ribosomal protein S12 methylthiotransferase|nr:30S ribosomal protein S12 methylthiotransferase RimO [Oscillospiraceae bacterium]